jgi:hypothetical protein
MGLQRHNNGLLQNVAFQREPDEVYMLISEDRISHLAHQIIDRLWRDDLVDFPDETKALNTVKSSIHDYFSVAIAIDELVRKKLASYSQAKIPGSRDWEILYEKLYKEEMAKKKW